jgi:polar amino acid transport system permease protein
LFVATVLLASFYFSQSHLVESLPIFADAAVNTVKITLCAALLTVLFAFLSGLGRVAPVGPVRWLASAYVEVFRGTSALVQLFWLFYVLPLFGPRMEPFTAGVLGVALNVGAYGAVVVEAAIKAIPRGQYEAATALNMSRWTRMRRVIFPQALVIMIPSWGNLFIQLFKLTALVSFIGLPDLTYTAYQMNQTTYRTVEVFTIVLLFYFAIGLLITISMRLLAKKASRGLRVGRS